VVKLTTHLNLVPKNGWNYTSAPPHAFTARRGTTSPLMQYFLPVSEANQENLLHDSRFRDVDVTLTNQPTPRRRALLQKLKSPQLVKKFPTFHGSRRFITTLTNDRNLCYPEPDQSRPYCPIHLHCLCCTKGEVQVRGNTKCFVLS